MAGNNFKLILIDATHGTNHFGMQLVTWAVQFEVINALDSHIRLVTIPLCHFLYTSAPSDATTSEKKGHTQRALNFMCDIFYRHNPEVQTNACMLDKDEAETILLPAVSSIVL